MQTPFSFLFAVFLVLILQKKNAQKQHEDPLILMDEPRSDALSPHDDPFGIDEDFPTTIHPYHGRIDYRSGEHVVRGSLGLLKGRMPYKEFQRILQCPKTEPGISGNRGSLHMLHLLPPSRKTIELMCAWAESLCVKAGDWKDCHKNIDLLKKGERILSYLIPCIDSKWPDTPTHIHTTLLHKQ